MNFDDKAFGGYPRDSDAFAALRDLLAIVGNPKAAQARADALQTQLDAIAKGGIKLAANRQAFEDEIAEVRRQVGEESAIAARRLISAGEKERELKALEDRIEAHADKTGFWESPTSIPIGSSGLTMTVF